MKLIKSPMRFKKSDRKPRIYGKSMALMLLFLAIFMVGCGPTLEELQTIERLRIGLQRANERGLNDVYYRMSWWERTTSYHGGDVLAMDVHERAKRVHANCTKLFTQIQQLKTEVRDFDLEGDEPFDSVPGFSILEPDRSGIIKGLSFHNSRGLALQQAIHITVDSLLFILSGIEGIQEYELREIERRFALNAEEEEGKRWAEGFFTDQPRVALLALLERLQHDVLYTEQEALGILRNQVSSTGLSIVDYIPVVVQREAAYKQGDLVQSRIFMSCQCHLDVRDIEVDGESVFIDDGVGEFKTMATEKGLQRKEVVVKIYNHKTGHIHEYDTDFSYYVE